MRLHVGVDALVRPADERVALLDLRVEALDAVGVARDALRGAFLEHAAKAVHHRLQLVDLLSGLRELLRDRVPLLPRRRKGVPFL